MDIVVVRDFEGFERRLALVRADERVAYVCAIDRYGEAIKDPTDSHVVGFPLSDVRPDIPAAASMMGS